MAEEMNALVVVRGRVKGSLSRILSFAEVPPEDCSFEMVVCRLERLEEIWREFVKYTDELHQYQNQAKFVNPEIDFETYEDKYLAARGKLYALKTKFAPRVEERKLNNDAIEKLAGQQAMFLEKFSTTTTAKESELPRINIPVFTGAYKDWPSFKDLFASAIEKKNNIIEHSEVSLFEIPTEG